jgi:hypothetical protein
LVDSVTVPISFQPRRVIPISKTIVFETLGELELRTLFSLKSTPSTKTY